MATDTPQSGGGPRSVDGSTGRLRNLLEGPNTLGNTRGFWVGFVVVVAALAAYPFAPTVIKSVLVSTRTLSSFLAFGFLALSLAVVWGYGGILSFGQSVFFGVAGYTFGIVLINVNSPLGGTVGLFAGVAGGALMALVLGYFIFYGGVRDVYATIITLVSTLVLKTFMDQTAGAEWTIGEAALGGFNGMNVPQLQLGVGETSVVISSYNTSFFYFALGLLVVTYLLLRVLVNSDYGRVMVAMREDEQRTRMFGYRTERVKLTVFVIGGALAGLSGVLFTTWQFYITPAKFGLVAASLPVIWVGLGGRKTLIGPVIATIALQYINNALGDIWAPVINGVLLVVIIMLLPTGVVPRARDLVVWAQRRAFDEPQSGPDPTESADPEVSDS